MTRIHQAIGAIAGAVLGLWGLGDQPASALYSTESEPNGTLATADDINHLFSLDFDPDIQFSTTFRHASIRGWGVANATASNFDFFAFDVTRAGTRGLFDIDRTRSTRNVACRAGNCAVDTTDRGFDTQLLLFRALDELLLTLPSDDALATLGARGSLANSPLGGGLSLDAFLDFTFEEAGHYIVGVNFRPLEGFRRQEGRYTLHVSLQDVPEPGGVMALAIVGGALTIRRRQSVT